MKVAHGRNSANSTNYSEDGDISNDYKFHQRYLIGN